MAKNLYFGPRFCQANSLPTIFRYLQKKIRPIFFLKMGQKAIFQISNYGQLWPNYDREVIFF